MFYLSSSIHFVVSYIINRTPDLQPVTVTRSDHWMGESVTVTLTWTWGWSLGSVAAKPTSKARAVTTARRVTMDSARMTHWVASVSVCVCCWKVLCLNKDECGFRFYWNIKPSDLHLRPINSTSTITMSCVWVCVCVSVCVFISMQLWPSWHYYDGSSLWPDQWGLFLQKICHWALLQPVSG